jgi:hypothetical protein
VLKSARPQCDWARDDVTERIALSVEGKSAFLASVLGVMRCRDAARGTRFQGFFLVPGGVGDPFHAQFELLWRVAGDDFCVFPGRCTVSRESV